MLPEQIERCTTLNGNCIQCEFQNECEICNIKNDIYSDDNTKYKKRKLHKSIKKSAHKHQYIEYIGECFSEHHIYYYPVARCSICGKIIRSKKNGLLFTHKTDNCQRILLSLSDIKIYYPELNVLVVDEYI